jgi:ketosteroid isomerase-like protein
MSDVAAILFANEAFYAAFACRDFAAMDRVWAREAPVTCIHPGWTALCGRETVIESWRMILGAGQGPNVACRAPRAFLFGDAAVVICHEEIGDGYLIATNVFVREGRAWKLVHHQAGAAPPPPEEEDPDDPLDFVQ